MKIKILLLTVISVKHLKHSPTALIELCDKQLKGDTMFIAHDMLGSFLIHVSLYQLANL